VGSRVQFTPAAPSKPQKNKAFSAFVAGRVLQMIAEQNAISATKQGEDKGKILVCSGRFGGVCHGA
jgi:hypothetical protein